MRSESLTRSLDSTAALNKLLERVDGLEAVFVTDREGVVVLSAERPDLPPKIKDPPISATFTVAGDQISKLGLGNLKSVATFYDHRQILQFSFPPLILTFIAKENANTGLLMDLGQSMKESVDIISQSIQ
ncbi:Ragulator complex protein lamtor3 [Gonapodya sp. JEL0774]|nr:Ragulator complex protein lamtor3 [Gonapodya sp. JEL0774]